MADFSGLLLKVIKNKEGKEKYLLYAIKEKWQEIVGEAAAKHAQPVKLEEHVLLVHTDNAAWSHNLLMLKRQLLGKLNEAVPLEEGKKRTYKVQDIRFFQGKIIDKTVLTTKEEPFIPCLDVKRRCPKCGVALMPDEKICSTCARQELAQVRRQIHKILCDAPWFGYRDCVKYLKCDRINFNDVKATMQERAKEKALDKKAKTEEKVFAVMLNLGKKPEEIDDQLLTNTLKRWKRRKTNVFAPGE